jgi:hypothetical protein
VWKTIAEGSGIRDVSLLRRRYGLGNWRKKKGVATVQLADGTTALAESTGTRRTALAR